MKANSISKLSDGTFEAVNSKTSVATLVKSAIVKKSGSSHLNMEGSIENINNTNSTVTIKFADGSYGTYYLKDLELV